MTPYIPWVQKKIGFKEFFESYHGSGVYKDTFNFSWSQNTASIFGSRGPNAYELPHLGKQQFKLPTDITEFGSRRRNLDFLCLDGLTITGHPGHMFNKVLRCEFSSCANMVLRDVNLDKLYFSHCRLKNLNIHNSYINQLSYNRCSVSECTFERARIRTFESKKCNYTSAPEFYESSINVVEFKEGSKGRFRENDETLLSLLRSVVTQGGHGNSNNIQKLFLKEKRLERLRLRKHLDFYPSEFPQRKNTESILFTLNSFFRKRSSRVEVKEIFLDKIKVLLLCCTPRYLLKRIIYILRYIGSATNSLVWGYGFKPGRVLAFALATIILFSSIYYNFGPCETRKDVVSSMYFSIVTFTTLGYGDIQPKSDLLRILCGLQALIGASLMGLFVGSVARKSTY